MKLVIIKKINELEETIAANQGLMSQGVQSADQLEVAKANEMGSLLYDSIQRNKESLIALIKALANVDNAGYGFCDTEDCEEVIPKARLKFNPAITKCVDCSWTKEQEDKQVA